MQYTNLKGQIVENPYLKEYPTDIIEKVYELIRLKVEKYPQRNCPSEHRKTLAYYLSHAGPECLDAFLALTTDIYPEEAKSIYYSAMRENAGKTTLSHFFKHMEFTYCLTVPNSKAVKVKSTLNNSITLF